MDLSVVIPCYNEEKYLPSLLESIEKQDFEKEKLELIFVDGGSTDKTVEILTDYQNTAQQSVIILNNPEKIVPVAMNKGLAIAKGKVLMRLDAHASYPSNYFSFLSTKLIESGADNVGCTLETRTISNNGKARSIRYVLSHKLGVGNSTFRTGTDKVREVDTVPFGCYLKKTLIDLDGYNSKLVRNQDIELNKRLKDKGGKILLFPDIQCIYYARDTFRGLIKNNFSNGKWNILTLYITGNIRSLSLRHFVPAFFVSGILASIFLYFFHPFLGHIGLAVLLFYLFAISLAASKSKHVALTILAFIFLHFSYGIGSLLGLIQIHKIKQNG